MERDLIAEIFKKTFGASMNSACGECGFPHADNDCIIAFANAIAAHEREEIAKFCEGNQVVTGLVGKESGKTGFAPYDKETMSRHEGMAYANAIRSRGTKGQ